MSSSIDKMNERPQLDFPDFSFRFRREGGRELIFDPARRKFVALTPEEWVRQHVIAYLHEVKGVPLSLMVAEASLVLNTMNRRCDLLVYGSKGKPRLMVECKSYEVKLRLEVFEQLARYNLVFNVPYLFVSNGLRHYCALVDHHKQSIDMLNEVPGWESLSG